MPESSPTNRAGGDNTENIDAELESDSGPGFAISVDLSGCTGAPACCRVWVRRRGRGRGRARTVRWLASRVRRAARLRGSLLLLAGDHLLPPGEPLRILRPEDTLRVTRVEHEWQHAFSFVDSDEDGPTNPPPTQPTPAVVQPTSPQKTTPAHIRKPERVTQPTSVPSFKRKFTVGETLFLLNQAEEERTQITSAEQQTSEVGHVAKKTNAMEQSEENVDYDALNRVKRRALALLEQATDEKDTDVVDAPKKKRRRVRRRKPAPKLHNPEESVQELNDSELQKNASQISEISNARNHVDLIEKDDSEFETKQRLRLLKLVSDHIQHQSKDQEVDDCNINGAVLSSRSPSPVHSASVQPALTPPAQSPPMWVMDVAGYAELPAETQAPGLVRNGAPPRAPRVVRALDGSEPPRDILV